MEANDSAKPSVVKTYPLFRGCRRVVCCSQDVLALHESKKRWQGAPVPECCGEPPGSRWTVVQRQVLYLGEINDCQREAWRKTIEVFEDGSPSAKMMALFPEDRACETDDGQVVQIRLKDVELRRPRQFGACWLAVTLYEQLNLDRFWAERLPPGRKGTRWDLITQALCCYRLVSGSSSII